MVNLMNDSADHAYHRNEILRIVSEALAGGELVAREASGKLNLINFQVERTVDRKGYRSRENFTGNEASHYKGEPRVGVYLEVEMAYNLNPSVKLLVTKMAEVESGINKRAADAALKAAEENLAAAKTVFEKAQQEAAKYVEPGA